MTKFLIGVATAALWFALSHAANAERICREVCRHVFMHFLLQIDTHFAKGAHHNIRAHAGITGNIAIWIVDLYVGRIVTGSDVSLFDGSLEELFELR